MNIFVERHPSHQRQLDEAKEYEIICGGKGEDVLLCRYFIDKNDWRQGPFEQYNKLGNIIEKGQYKDNKKDGVWQWCLSSGEVAEEVTYKNGEIDGPYRDYRDGRLFREGFRRGNGKYGIWTWYDEKGNVVKRSRFDACSKEVILYEAPKQQKEDVAQDENKAIEYAEKARFDALKTLAFIATLAKTESQAELRIIRREIVSIYHERTTGLTAAQIRTAKENLRVRG